MNSYLSGQTANPQKESSYTIESSRGKSTFNNPQGIPIIIDKAKFTKDDYDFVLTMSAFEIESVELLRAWQTLAYTSGAIDGAILVKTRAYKDREPLPSKGVLYSPIGLSPLSYPFKEYIAKPLSVEKPGSYRLIVDIISDSGIHSYESRIEVTE